MSLIRTMSPLTMTMLSPCVPRSLEQLDILGNRNVSLGAVSDLLARLTSLRMLDVSFCHQLGEENIGQLVTNYPGVSIKWSWSE